MKIKSITIFSVFLLLFSFATTATACPPPDCGDCETWNGEECVPYGDCWGGCPSCESCVGCYCQCTSECGCGGNTCSGCRVCSNCSCVDDDDNCTGCKSCVDGSCVDDDDNCTGCKSCVDGSCVDDDSKCADCMNCVAGNCVDILCAVLGECERCNETTGECESICDPDQCCDHDACVAKCDADGGGTCTWTNPPVGDPFCNWLHETDHSCQNPGARCSWKVVDGPGNNAACAPCDPGCSLDSTYCVKLEPIVCKTTLTGWPPFIDCTCTGTPDLVTYEYPGTRYICP